jgi:phosphoserine phosphatase RsbU/P
MGDSTFAQKTSLALDTSSIAVLEDRLIAQADRFEEIYRVGTVITSLLDLDRVLATVMESALAMTSAEVGQIAIFKDDSNAGIDISWGLSKTVVNQLVNQQGIDLWESIRETGLSYKVDVLESDPEWRLQSHEFNITGFLAVPFKTQNRLVGAVIVANKTEEPIFNVDDLFSLEMLGCFAAVAVENSFLHSEALAKQKMDAELDLARQIQKTLMPRTNVNFDRLAILTHNKMALQVGGDFQDIIEVAPGKYFLVVADVSSKGVPAALLMTSTRALIRAYADESIDLPRVIKNVNIQLSKDSAELRGMFVTLILICIDLEAGVIKSLNAGHPPGFLRYPDGAIKELKTGGPFIGQFDTLEFREEVLPLMPGMRLFLYTDGAFECFDRKGRMFGLAGLRSFFAENCFRTADELIANMLVVLDKYSANPQAIDDTTLLLADIS